MMKRYITLCMLALVVVVTAANAKTVKHAIWQDGKIVHPTAAMAAPQLTALLNQLRGKANDAEKLDVLKEGLKGNGITVEQVITLLGQFNEDAKLEGAIYAFQFTTDFKKYDKVQDVFGKDENKHKLQDYVDRHKK